MGFVCNGRYVLKPVSAEDAERYVDLQLDCLEQTYSHIIDPDFGARQRTERDSWIREFRENVSVAGARAFLAYEVSGWTPEGGLSCAVGSAVDWDSPVGLVLSRPGPLAWELELPVEPMPEGSRELTQLYTLARTAPGWGRRSLTPSCSRVSRHISGTSWVMSGRCGFIRRTVLWWRA